MVLDADVGNGSKITIESPSADDIEVLIKEAKRHQRRRYATVGLAAAAVLTISLILVFAGSDNGSSPKTVKPPETSIPAAGSPTCRTDQLAIQYKGSQGAAGNIAAAFWVADTSGASCSVRSSVTVDLLNKTRSTQLSASKTLTAPIQLTPNTTMPSGDVVPHGEQLAFVTLFWPTIWDASPNGQCSQLLFTPTAFRFAFNGIPAITVTQLDTVPPQQTSEWLSICGSNLSVFAVGPITG